MVSSTIKNISITLFLALFLLPNQSFSQVNPDANFLSLHVGDIRQYLVEETISGRDTSFYFTEEVIDSDTLEGRTYFMIPSQWNGRMHLIGIDSTDASVWKNNTMIDSLSITVGDIRFGNEYYGYVTCISDTVQNVFGIERRTKTFDFHPAMTLTLNRKYKYSYGIGLIETITTSINVVSCTTLVYAKIDGVEYGELSNSDNNICLRDSTLHLFQNENNPNFADTTWLINKASEILMVDSVINNHLYSYLLDVFFSDSSSSTFGIYKGSIDPVSFRINAFDSVKTILRNPDLCPVCDGGEINVFTDSLHIFTNSKDNPVLLLAIIGDGTLDAENTESGKLNFSLQQNYPNPFNPSTTIKYTLPVNVKGEMANVKLTVFNILGQEVATLVNKQQKAGNYEIKFDASELTSGIYFYRLQSIGFIESKKMLLIK